YMGFIKENAAYSVKQALAQFLKGGDPFEAAFEDHLDDGTLLKVKIVINGGPNPPETINAVIDFTGTGPGHCNDNLNTPISVTRSAVLYVLRALTDSDIPLNSGCLQPIRIVIPDGSILSPVYPLPVASGNVETSQRITDVLLGALKAAAASQGTMNNLLFQVEGETPYYETIAGGSGASDGCPGTSGVQVHMTNTRITDPEILETRHPGVRLEKFVLRKGSGGKGRFMGGDGTIREFKFLKPAKLSIISERRVYSPYGLEGGKPGKKGVNLLKKTNGEIVELPHRVVRDVKKGESIIIKTPGGGGFGKNKL
ncbi:MAG: hydantoinase B/oxoprolinase family protein, partial [Nitrospinota bacterium]|nr:hydantoinase B/oxoprolinase family protein [Nitrospinota bacterium]